jgi:glutathione S-transferase
MLADLVLGVLVYRYVKNPIIQRPRQSNLDQWVERLRARPSYQQWVDEPLV